MMLLRSGCWRSRPPSSGAAAAKGPEPAPPVSARRPRSSQIEIGGGRPGPKLGPDSAPPPRPREAWRTERLTKPAGSCPSWRPRRRRRACNNTVRGLRRVRAPRFRAGGMVLFIPWRGGAERGAGSCPSWRPRRRRFLFGFIGWWPARPSHGGRAMGSASPTAGLQQHGEGLRTRSRSAFSWPGRWRARLNLLMRVSLVNRSFRHVSRARGGGAESGPSFGPGRPPPISIWLDRGRRALTGGVSSGPLAAAAPS